MQPSSRQRLRWSALVGAVVGVLLVLVPATAAWAHAELVTSTPADGAVLDQAPTEVVLQFSESVSVRPDGVRVLDADGQRVDAGDASAQGDTVTVPLDGTLGQGSYVVAWRVVSADSHPVHAAFTFSVGRETTIDDSLVAKAFGSGDDRPFEVAAAIARAITYLAVFAVSGFVLVGGSLRRSGEPSPVTRWTMRIGVLGLAALLAQIPLQGALATGRGLTAVREGEVLKLALADGFGLAVLVTACGLLAVLIVRGLPFEGAARHVAMGGALVAPLGFALAGHTTIISPAILGYLTDAAHALAGAIWFGGLAAAAVVVRRRRRARDPFGAAEAIATFSGWAAATAAAVVVTGSVLAFEEVGGWHALTATTYGRLLLAKVAAVGVVLALAGWNRFRLVPRVAAAAVEEPAGDDAGTWRRLSTVMRAEVGLLVVVLAITGVLVNVVPAKTSAAGGAVTVTAPLGAGTVDVTVDPARTGRNDIHVYILDRSGRPDDRYDSATFSLALPAEDVGPLERTPVRAGPGHFQLVATELSLSGDWDITVTVKPDRFTEQSATVTVPVR